MERGGNLKKMTIKELYEQAVADGVEDYDLIIFTWAERHYPEYYQSDIIVEDREVIIYC